MDDRRIINLGKETFCDEAKALENIANQLSDDFLNVVHVINKSKGKVIVSGIGKSAHIANKIVATLNSTGVFAQFLHAAEAIHGDLGLIREEDIVMVLSKSGNTPEIKNLVTLLKSYTVTLVGLTSHKESYLAKHADYVLHVPIEKEAGPNNLAPTTSTTAQLVMGDALAVALMHVNKFTEADFAKSHPGGSLGKRLYWKVEDLVDRDQKPLVNVNDNIREAIVAISKSRNGITAVEDQGELVGVITDGDLRRMLFNEIDFKDTLVKEIMSKNPKTIQKEALATQALEMIELHKIGQLLVVDSTKKYFGILDFQDLLKEGII
ncbi:MAG: SIS domain-containing protein [Flavobacteriales bacterium]